ncbi:MAG TPA: ketosynthase chain-length factor [Jatrophihabitans sp.]|nr:ketosynthase chain-length factor [Jatrophihabitans sp.]
MSRLGLVDNGKPVITGIGVTAPNGLGLADYWAATCAGVSGIGPISRFDASQYASRLAGEVPAFEPVELLPNRLLPQTDHMTRLALIAAEQALIDAGLDGEPDSPYDRGIVTASSAGGFEFGQAELERFFGQGTEFMGAYMSFAWFYAVNSGQISIRHQLKGPGGVLVADHAGGLEAIAHARRHIRRGSKVIVSGGVDGAICPWGWVAQLTSGRVSTSDDPAAAYLPFDARAAGHVPAEGGAILIVEDAEAARQRGAERVYGTVAGYSATFDPKPGTGRPPALRRAIEQALSDAELAPAEVDVVFADAAAVPEQDRIEADAIAAVFGPRAVPVTAPKTMLGRIHAGGGALDVAAALLAIRDGVIPPTVNVRPAPDCPIELVTGEAVRQPVRTALVLARGQGGFNSALVVQAA